MATNHSHSQQITSAQFEEAQFQWLCQRIENELCWQAVELFIKRLWDGDDADRVIEKFKILERYGFTIDRTLLAELREKFDGDTNIFRRPEVFQTSPANFDKAHNGIKKLEQIFNVRPNPRLKWLGMPAQPAQFRRANITTSAYVFLDVVKEQCQIRYGRGFSREFEKFIRNKILSDADLSRFLFRGKTIDEQKRSDREVDPFNTFTSVRNTSRRQSANKRLASPMYRQSYEYLSKIRGVIMRPPIDA